MEATLGIALYEPPKFIFDTYIHMYVRTYVRTSSAALLIAMYIHIFNVHDDTEPRILKWEHNAIRTCLQYNIYIRNRVDYIILPIQKNKVVL